MFQRSQQGKQSDTIMSDSVAKCTRCGSSKLEDTVQSKSQSNLPEVTSDSGILTDVNLCDQCSSDSGFISCSTNSALSISSRSEDQWMTSSTGLDSSSVISSVYSTDSGIDLQKFSELSIDQEETSQKSDLTEVESQVVESQIEVVDVSRRNKLELTPAVISWLEMAFGQDDDGDTYLHLAIIHELVEVVFALINGAPEPNFLDILNNLNQSPLHLAVLTGQSTIVRKLVSAGADVTMRDRKGNTPLHITCENGDIECTSELLATPTATKGRNVQQNLEMRNYDGLKCIHLATMGGHVNILDLLYRRGADVNAQDGKGGNNPLYIAVRAENVRLVRFLVDTCKVKIDSPNFAGVTPIQLAYYNVSHEISDLLLKRGAYYYPIESDSESDSDTDYEMSEISDSRSYKGSTTAVC